MPNIAPLSPFLIGALGSPDQLLRRLRPLGGVERREVLTPSTPELDMGVLAEPAAPVGVREFQGSMPLMYDQASQNRVMDMMSGAIPQAIGALAPQDPQGMSRQDAPLIPDQPVPNGWANSPPVFPQGIPQASMGPQPMGPQPMGPQPMGPQPMGPQPMGPAMGEPQQRTFIEPAQQQQLMPQQGQRGSSNALMMGLLSAGLGILQNNYGKYGQAGPAIGAGGMQGVNTYLGVQQQEIENRRRDELAAQQARYQDAQSRYQDALIRQGGRRLDIEEGREAYKQAQDLQTRNLALMLAGNDPEQQKIAIANPDKYLDFKVAQMRPEYKERSVKEGNTAHDEYSIDGGKNWSPVPGGGKYDLRAAKGGSDINLKVEGKQAEAFTKPIAEQVDASYARAQGAVSSQRVVENLRQRLEDPKVISGIGANVRLGAAQVAQLLGGEGADLAATREVIQNFAELTVQSRHLLKGQGQVTEFEQKTLEKARSGDIGMTLPELKALVNVFTRVNRAAYDEHSNVMNRLSRVPGSEQGQKFYQTDPFPGPNATMIYNPDTGKLEKK